MAPKRRTSAQNGPEQKKAKPDATSVVKHLLDTGSTYCEELGIDLENGGSAALFQWLCCSVIFSIGIAESSTFRAAKGLLNNGLDTPKSVKEADMREKIDAVNSEGSVQRGPSMSGRLEAAAELLLEKYDGDLYKLREAAERDPEQERKLLKEFKGLGDAAVSIFCREAQLVWDELYPCVDERTLKSTAKAGLPGSSAKELTELVGNDRTKFVRLLAAAVKADLRGGKTSHGSTAKPAAKNKKAEAKSESGKKGDKGGEKGDKDGNEEATGKGEEGEGKEEELEDEEAELDDEGPDAEQDTKAEDNEEPEADENDEA